jgi:hypothetical protein
LHRNQKYIVIRYIMQLTRRSAWGIGYGGELMGLMPANWSQVYFVR